MRRVLENVLTLWNPILLIFQASDLLLAAQIVWIHLNIFRINYTDIIWIIIYSSCLLKKTSSSTICDFFAEKGLESQLSSIACDFAFAKPLNFLEEKSQILGN